jgi:hypothetical protein
VPGSVRFGFGTPRGFPTNAGLCGVSRRDDKRLICRITQCRTGGEGPACHAGMPGWLGYQYPVDRLRACRSSASAVTIAATALKKKPIAAGYPAGSGQKFMGHPAAALRRAARSSRRSR